LGKQESRYSHLFKDPLVGTGELHIDSLPVQMFREDISNKLQYSSILESIREPISSTLSGITYDKDDRLF